MSDFSIHDGQYNIGHICTRQQCEEGRAEQAAMRFISPGTLEARDFSFNDLEVESNRFANVLAALAVLAILVPHSKDKHFPLGQPTLVRWAIYYLMALVILFLGTYGAGQVFIYNQF